MRRALVALVASVALNAAVFAAIHSAGAFALSRRAEAVARVGLAAVSAARWRANRLVSAERAQPTPLEPARRPPPAVDERPDPRGEVVAAPPSADRRAPERWRFLSDHDGSAPRDVQSREAGKRRWDTPLARPTPGPEGAQGIPRNGEGGSAETPVPGREGSADAGEAVARARAALAPAPAGEAPSGSAASAAREAAPAAAAGEGGARSTGPYDPRLLPTASTFERLAGGPGERLHDVEEGDATGLNTRRFRFAEFFLRVKRAIAREWDPNRTWDARDPASQRYGRRTRGTTVDIVLEPAGGVRDVRLVASSGLDFYDREVVRAIRAASPFPNPPRALVGADGRILLARWRFELAWDDARPRFALPDAPRP
ncbi:MULTISPECIES: TonB family protein [unclassified Anaeromyxobacter]|uniref:TonB family protein n=1 Tax=unclassified Anaeromyxobacter TaxID=2620896 RepID=UPI001F587468|nr:MULTISPECIES: TonB family protein [unclassified Anaeromyxobacter]